MALERYFSSDYASARERFRKSAAARGIRTASYPIPGEGPDGEDLTIDVGRLGRDDAPNVVVVSSGVHGVEGFLGSAVQVALLEDHLRGFDADGDTAIVFIHAVNPYGMAWLRRFNEDNVDLNRNFLLEGQIYEGAPAKYPKLDPLLNPKRPARRISAFLPKAIAAIVRHGLPALKASVAGGQYEYPKGVFFGGRRAAVSTEVLRTNLAKWTGGAERVIHLDFHSGLGKSGKVMLVVEHPDGSPEVDRFSDIYGREKLYLWEPQSSDGESEIRGGLGRWAEHAMTHCEYRCVVVEFGTVNILKVIHALHLENRAHHWMDPTSPGAWRAKQCLLDAFVPPQKSWRREIMRESLRLIDQTIESF